MGPALTRTVSSTVRLQVGAPADLVLSVAVAADLAPTQESLTVTSEAGLLEPSELLAAGGTRLHRVARAPVGTLVVRYDAVVPLGGPPAPLTELEGVEFTRPSRYCDSDRLTPVARELFGGRTGEDLVRAVVRWALDHITYAPGSSGPLDGALETYLRRQGVCRDTSHVVTTMLRALGVPARLVSVYAPGLVPMDFHAVTEVALDGRWYVVDGTGLAPRGSLVRIATGRDAADTAFLTVNAGQAGLLQVQVGASVAPALPADDGLTLTQLR
ncbi:Transglutaminase-like superfamily protein [Nocardioides alpinus]|uniref:Transglutaminase family protein n=1 Tax=Nocardioides alpinus TaxID=748909 RepID=A0A1I0X9I6_9ACTN|nr:transglutaminase family protein [Nocardioides alpinus]PKH44180.1 transglutaminase family protein [Nocardioides alpinus]SFA97000.1 Transglutaminase-like superfamily protein [Nocardioides alpinus]